MTAGRPTWKLRAVRAYTAVCPHCGYDLLSGDDLCCWIQPEGVSAAMEDRPWCDVCGKPVSEDGYSLDEDAEADAASTPQSETGGRGEPGVTDERGPGANPHGC